MRVTFIIADTYVTEEALHAYGQSRPYRKRSVTIDLTADQCAALALREVQPGKQPVYEQLLECFVEPEK